MNFVKSVHGPPRDDHTIVFLASNDKYMPFLINWYDAVRGSLVS